MNTKSTYSEKLKNPAWQKKRLEILDRDKWTCQFCADKDTTLHVHHTEYKGDPWQIESSKLKTVCDHCHHILHHLSRGYNLGVKAIRKTVYDNQTYYFFSIISEDNCLFLFALDRSSGEWHYGNAYYTEKYMKGLINFYQSTTTNKP